MLIIPLLKSYRRRAVVDSSPPLPPPPVLVLASFAVDELGAGILTLGFDGAVDVSGIVPEAFAVIDGPGGLAYVGSGPVGVLSPSSFTLAMTAAEGEGGPEVLLSASSSNGMVSVEGGVWAGTLGEVELPIPAPPPVVPAVVVSVWCDGGSECTITFDKEITLLGAPDDGSIYIAGLAPGAASLDAPEVLRLTIGGSVIPGGSWNIYSQPDWISTPIEFPQAGIFTES